jgi:uncharacterized protein (TIRG00374 family)
MNSHMRRLIGSGLQLALGAGLLIWLISGIGNKQELLTAISHTATHPFWLLGAFAASLGCILICVLRWSLLLKQIGLPLPFRTALYYFIVGQFFNAFLLGSSGGDLVRATAIAASTRSSHKRTEAFASVLIDRMLGIIALAWLAAIGAAIQWEQLKQSAGTRAVALFAMACALTSILMLAAASSTRIGGALTGLATQTHRGIYRALTTLQVVMQARPTCTRTLVLSLGNHILAACSFWCLAQTLGISLGSGDGVLTGLAQFGAFLSLSPIIHLIAAIPLTPSGLGTRDAATVALLGIPYLAVPASQAISLGLLTFGMATLWSLISGAIFLTTRFMKPAALAPDPANADPVHP